MKNKNTMGLAAAVLLSALVLAGCGRGNSAADTPTPPPASGSTGSTDVSKLQYRLGLGVVAEGTALAGSATASNTAAVVLLDEAGQIVDIRVDMVQNKQSADLDGVPKPYDPPLTAREKGDSYGLKNASTLGLEWHRQADNFEQYVIGMDQGRLEQIPLGPDGKTTDVDLLAGCTIAVDDMVAAAVKACRSAQPVQAAQGQTVSLGMVSVCGSSRPATDDADGVLQLKTTVLAAVHDPAGRVTAAICDEAETNFGVDDDGEVTAPHRVLTKLEKGEEYGMKQASPIGKEWYEQSRAFCDWLAGQDAAALGGGSEQQAQADLAGGCTIDMTNLLAAAIKAVQQK